MKSARYAARHALGFALLMGAAAPALAHGPVLKCVLLDEATVRCRGGYAEGEDAEGERLEVVALSGKTLVAGKLGRDSTISFPRPKTPYYVMFDLGPGYQAIVEQDEIALPRARDRARWMRR